MFQSLLSNTSQALTLPWREFLLKNLKQKVRSQKLWQNKSSKGMCGKPAHFSLTSYMTAIGIVDSANKWTVSAHLILWSGIRILNIAYFNIIWNEDSNCTTISTEYPFCTELASTLNFRLDPLILFIVEFWQPNWNLKWDAQNEDEGTPRAKATIWTFKNEQQIRPAYAHFIVIL